MKLTVQDGGIKRSDFSPEPGNPRTRFPGLAGEARPLRGPVSETPQKSPPAAIPEARSAQKPVSETQKPSPAAVPIPQETALSETATRNRTKLPASASPTHPAASGSLKQQASSGKFSADIPAPALPGEPAASGLLKQQAFSGKLPADIPAQTSPGEPVISDSLKQLILTLGLPQDTLSSSLLSFFKFFSLPMDTKLIRQLRQEILSLKSRLSHKEGDPKLRDFPRSAALATVAAAGKGFTLSTDALERYAYGNEGEKDAGRPSGEKGTWPPSAAGLRDLADRAEAENPLLELLNRASGRDGKRWITLPFSFIAEGVEFKVSLRIVLTDTNTIPWKVSRFFLDIRGERRRWSFMLENPGEKGSRAVLGIFPPPEQGKKAALEKELLSLLKPLVEQLTLRDIDEGFLFEEDDLNVSPAGFDEEV